MGLNTAKIIFLFASCITTSATAASRAASRSSHQLDPVHTIYEFPYDTYVENLAVRPNGQILVTSLSFPQLWLVDPHLPGQVFVVHEFSEALGLSGIVEYQPDVFAICMGNYSIATDDPGAGTWAIWSIDLGSINITSNTSVATNPPTVSQIVAIPEATTLNGLSVLSSTEKQHLIAGDVRSGVVYSVDIDTGDHAVVINNTYTNAGSAYAFGDTGTDGIQIRNGNVLYFSNFGQGNLVKVLLNITDGTPIGDFETVATTLTPEDQWDDFTFDCDGNVWIAAGWANTVEKISQNGNVETMAGNLNSTAIAEPTSVKFGRREDDANVLYVTTAGGEVTPVDGDVVIGGQVVGIKTGAKGSFC